MTLLLNCPRKRQT